MRYKTLIGLGVSCLLLGQGIAWGQARGYRLRGDRLEVATSAHWRVWEAPAGMADISFAGSVTPVFISSPANAIENHGDFSYELPGNLADDYDTTYRDGNVLMARGGIKKAGSSASLAARIMDGNPRTFWEPSSTDAVENWWVEIDLGRLVSATRIVVRFSEDSETNRADPFLQFKVHSATGQSPFGTGSSSLDFTFVGGTTQPNEDQRLFEFDIDPLLKATDEWSGRLVQYVRISATASRGARAELMKAEEFEALVPDDRGSIDHVWVIAGEERLVSAERYAELPAQQQGGMRHYRRERPRLAEVEVWTVGDNISIGIVDRGGELRDPNPAASPRKAFDGRITTNWSAVVYSTVGAIADWGVLTMDLGALFRVNAVRVITRLAGGAKTLFGYQLRGSDGSLAPDGTLVWDVLNSEDRQLNISSTRLFEDRFPLRNVRFLEFRNIDVARATLAYKGNRITSTVTEIQIFAKGFLPELVLTSDLIDLQSTRTLTTIDWDADTPAGSAVELRTRSGNDLREINRYFKKDGTEVDSTAYKTKVPSFQQGDITTEVLPGPGWSNWSQAYVAPGEIVRSPSPRRYTMIQAT
ncbi:MAG TPA: discoidin domain-containing protein, partial [Candidatus Latescibacteria bacterium]|nr:discoidin domain-containing protein [Candidatus Latescibacterota bacterium]